MTDALDALKDAAQKANVSYATLLAVAQGRLLPPLELLRRLGGALGVSTGAVQSTLQTLVRDAIGDGGQD